MTPSDLPPAGWHADPTGRHRLRYWDGARWTEHVSDDGGVGVDPLAGSAPTSPEDAGSSDAGGAAARSGPQVGAGPPAMGAPPPSVPTADATAGAAPWSVTGPPGAVPVRAIGGLASALTVVLGVAVASSVLAAIAFVNRVLVVDDLLDLEATSLGELVDLQQRAEDADDYVGLAAILTLVVSLGVFVLLVVWMWRVAKNAQGPAARTNPRLGPGWAIGGWFIPLANLVIPVLVMQDLWRASNPATPRGDPMWRTNRGSALVGWWWATYLLGFLRITSGGEADTRSELEALQVTDALAAAGSVLTVVAAILLIRVVRAITRGQEALLAGQLTPA